MKIPNTSAHTRILTRCLNSTRRRLALIAPIVFGVAFVVGYTGTAAAPSVLHSVLNTVPSATNSQSKSQAQPKSASRFIIRNNRDLNQPIFAYSLSQMFEAKVATDKDDYRPGETAIITGSGFWPNEIVTLQVVHIDGGEEGSAGHEPWNVVADSQGAFTTTWFVNPDDSLGATFLLTATGNSSGLTAQTTFTDKPAANLDQCANGGVGDPPVQCIGSAWQNGNLNDQQAHYLEGQTVPYRAVFTDLTAGATYTTTIQWDTTQSGDHATDYLMTFSTTEVTADPCTGVAGVPTCAGPNTFPIPPDPNVAGAGVTQPGGQNFTIYNGSITGVSAYTLTGTYAGTSKTSIVVTFTATASGTTVMAWGGHISTRLDWGVANSAIAIDGSPYHMRLIDFTCSNVANCNVGNQDRSLSASAIFFPAILNITKVTVPSPQTTAKLFAYTTTGTDVSNFSLDNDPNTNTSNTKSFSLSDTSTRTITEGDPSPEFTLTDLFCNQVPDPQLNKSGTVLTNAVTGTVTVEPEEGETINCTYVNTQGAKIIVKKETDPDGDPQSFSFTASYDNDGFSLSDGQQNDSGFLNPGTYSVSETVPAGWDLESATCSDGSAPGSISLQAGETVTCTFTNEKDANIVVIKQTNPDGDPQSFTFTASYDNDGFSLSDGQQNNSGDLDPGTYSVSETVPAGWDLDSATCSDGSDPGTISLQAGETVTCTFTNEKDANIVVIKQTNPDGDPQSFSFTASYDNDGFSLSDGQQNDSGDLDPGTYSVSETVPAGWDLDSATCSDGSDPGTISLQAGETVTCTFTNEKDANIVVIKQTNPDGDPQSFSFTASYDNDGFSLSDGQQNDSGDLDPGTYSVSETVPAGWDLESATCSDGSAPGSISLQAGETVTCTFTNEKDANIVVIKQTNPDGDPQSFSFTASYDNDGFSLSDGQQNDSGDLDPGTYSVSETVPAGWDLESATCSDGSAPGSISLQAGETVTCTFTNEKDANIIVIKQTDPDGDPQSFSFTASYDNDGFSLSDGQQNDSGDLDPGTYSVSETVPAGWDLDSATCSDGSDPSSISLQAGETVTCTFTNEKDANIVVIKQTDPDGDPQSFSFTASYDNDGFSLSDGQQNDSGDLDPGTYTVSETVPAGWDLESATCSDGSDPSSISLQAGETVTCTFTNEKDANIVVIKQTDPDGDPQSFSFTASYDNDGFSLSDGQQNDSGDLDPGTYSVSETVPPGWDLESATCSDGSAPGSISLQAGETVTCTFTNEKDANIIVIKQTDPDGDPQSFTFTASYDNDGFSLSDGQQDNSGDLDPGTYSVSETVPVGWDLTGATCSDGSNPGSISLQAGETVTCTFNNRKRARLIVEKQTNPDGATGSFTFTGTAAGTISDGQNIPVGNLVPGTYTSTENNPAPNFDLTSIVCTDANSTGDVPSRTATFRLEPGETVKCTFTNTQRGMAEIIKTVSNLPPPAGQSFTFEIRQGATTMADGTVLETKNTDASGNISFTTKLKPGETYQICEWVFPGWNTNLVGDGPLFVPNSLIPPALPNPNVNNLTVCANFTVQPGQTRTFNVNNSPPPGGRALTIGFWKNWASCSNSNGKGQKNMLDLALGIASATTTNPPGGLVGSAQYPGALWPNYAAQWYLVLKGNPTSTVDLIKTAPDCAGAVALLDKRSIDGKKKMASDPLFNMTAQLIAAQLNRFMGAGINGTTIMNIDRAVLLNGKYKFNGNTYNPKLTTADTNTANCLATQLDNYNNGNPVSLCP